MKLPISNPDMITYKIRSDLVIKVLRKGTNKYSKAGHMAKRHRSWLLCFLLSTTFLATGPAFSESISASEAAKLYPVETTYSIYRKGKIIGKHKLVVSSLDNQIKIQIDSNIAIRVLKIPVFRFRYISTELWENDRLVEVNSVTTTNKDVEKASLKNEDKQSLVTYNDKQSATELIQYATNHWNISAVDQAHLFNTVKGVKSDVRVELVGEEALDINGTTLDTRHYAYTGDITAQTWYDKNNRWVKLAFLGSDGSQIIYLIDNP